MATDDQFKLSAADLANLCDGLVVAWHGDAAASAKGASPTSQAAIDLAEVVQLIPDGILTNLGHAHEQMAGQMVDAIGLLVQSMGTLLRAEPLITLGLWPIVRAEVEYAGRVAWLLQSFEDEGAGNRRVARALLEQLSGLQRQRLTAEKWDSLQAKKFKLARNALLAKIHAVFDDIHIPMTKPDDIAEWRIGGEKMMPLGKAATLFFSLNVSNGKALYDILSDCSHPSVISLALQSTKSNEDDVTIWSYPATPQVLDFQVRLGCIALYKSALSLLNYFGYSSASIETWAAAAPGHWFGGKP